MNTLYLILFLLIILIGSVATYIYYLKEKNHELESIKRGFCPKCGQKGIMLTDQRSAGCCGPKILTFTCPHCEYTNSFSIETPSCSS
ncbi:MAG: hypothetical protein IE885_03935 [Campylobacterales bacterium]|nr:hypothetical protein [Campylobacterales bacterium]